MWNFTTTRQRRALFVHMVKLTRDPDTDEACLCESPEPDWTSILQDGAGQYGKRFVQIFWHADNTDAGRRLSVRTLLFEFGNAAIHQKNWRGAEARVCFCRSSCEINVELKANQSVQAEINMFTSSIIHFGFCWYLTQQISCLHPSPKRCNTLHV